MASAPSAKGATGALCPAVLGRGWRVVAPGGASDRGGPTTRQRAATLGNEPSVPGRGLQGGLMLGLSRVHGTTSGDGSLVLVDEEGVCAVGAALASVKGSPAGLFLGSHSEQSSGKPASWASMAGLGRLEAGRCSAALGRPRADAGRPG